MHTPTTTLTATATPPHLRLLLPKHLRVPQGHLLQLVLQILHVIQGILGLLPHAAATLAGVENE